MIGYSPLFGSFIQCGVSSQHKDADPGKATVEAQEKPQSWASATAQERSPPRNSWAANYSLKQAAIEVFLPYKQNIENFTLFFLFFSASLKKMRANEMKKKVSHRNSSQEFSSPPKNAEYGERASKNRLLIPAWITVRLKQLKDVKYFHQFLIFSRED